VAPEPVDLLLPASFDVPSALSERVRVRAGREHGVDRVLLDSFDGRLRAAGLRAEHVSGTLTLHEPGAPTRRAQVDRAPRHLVTELPRGPLRDRLAGVLEERALLPAVRVRSVIQSLAVLDGRDKTVVRLTVERAEAVLRGGRRVRLSARLTVEPVLGYDDQLAGTLNLLQDRLGLEPAEQPLYDEAVIAAGGRPEGVSTKPKIALEPGTRSDAAATVVLARLLGIAEANLPGTQQDLDPEFLHDLRVSVRRARSVLRELKDVHDPEQRAHLRTELKYAQALTGPVRDLDVQLLEWDELVAPLEPDRRADLEPLRALLLRRRARELARLRRGLRGARFRGAIDAWRELATAAPPAEPEPEDAALPIEGVAGRRIRKVYRRMVRDGRKIDADSHPDALHDLRKRGKELRYLLELFGSPFPSKVVKPLVSTLKDLQDVLGRFQDRAVQIETLRDVREELASEPGGPAALIALGAALDALLADQRAARDEFAERFAPFAASDQRALVRKTFPTRARA
jgi:CHAD domain-containing protein